MSTAIEYAPLPLGPAGEETAHVPRKAKPRKDWTVKKFAETSKGEYFRLDVVTGRQEQPVTVKFTRFNTYVCMTCLSVTCPHAATTRAFHEASA